MFKWLALILLLATPIMAADVTITWRDSTQIEDAYMVSSGLSGNYGRMPNAGAVINIIRYNYGVYYNPIFRVTNFKDSTDNYSGLLIDSVKFVGFLQVATYDVNDASYVYASGITETHDWVEGNRAGDAAVDCEVSADSSQTIGSGGTCATATEWAADNARGAGDTLGFYTGERLDSTICTNAGDNEMLWDNESAGDSIVIYLDTVMCNNWKDGDDNNGFVLLFYDGPNDNYYHYMYASESNGGSLADSTPYVTLYGHTTEAGATGQVIIIGEKNEEVLDSNTVYDRVSLPSTGHTRYGRYIR